MKKYILIILSLFIVTKSFTQSPADHQLAFKYYNTQEFDKASELFNKLFKQSNSKSYFNYYIDCLIQLKDFETAEKTTEKQIKRNPEEIIYKLQLAYIYQAKKETDKANILFEEVINNMPDNKYTVIELANTFIQKRDYPWAEKVYLKAREKSTEDTYRFELASVYSMDRNYTLMVNEYVELLTEDETQISNVQNHLQYLINNDINDEFSDILRKSVLRKLQQSPNQTILNELLIWLFVQKKNFKAALTQEIAIDKRFDLAGQRILNLGDLAYSNDDFAAAKSSFQYIVDLGTKSFFYPKAKIRILKVKYTMLAQNPKSTKLEFENLENDYLNTMNDLGQNRSTIALMIELAHIQAFYLNKAEHAIELLDYASGVSGIKPDQQADCFLEMGDIRLMTGDVWEATLIYAKVEKDNEQNPIGHEAKFRKAQLAFYIGDFTWAQVQLDALKAATTKLIANDAMQLSQLIKDNLSEDTVTEALQIYARAGLLELRNNDSLAMITLDTIAKKFPTNSIMDETIMQKANIMHKQGKFDEEAILLQQIIDTYYYDLLADDAVFRLAELNELKFKDIEKAKELYKTIITEFPASIYVSEARKRFRDLRGDNSI